MRSRASMAFAVVAATAALVAPAAQGSAGDLLVGQDGGSSTILRVKPNGTHSNVASGAPIGSPAGMDFAHDGKLWVADYDTPTILHVNPIAHVAFLTLTPAPLDEPLDVEVGPDDRVYVAEDSGVGSIFKISFPSGNYVSVGDSSRIINPFALEIRHSDGMIFVADASAGLVSVNPKTGQEKVVANTTKVGAPQGIALSPDGKVAYLAGGDKIYKVVLKTGATSPVASGGDLAGMYELVLEPSGKLVAASFDSDLLVRVNPANGNQSPVAGGSVSAPEGLQIESPRCGGRLATITGSQKADVLTGSKYPDVIAGLGGRDLIRGLKGGDIICGGEGPDKMIGGRGSDRLIGGPGRDKPIQ